MVLIFHFKCTLKYRLQFVSIWTSLEFCRLVRESKKDPNEGNLRVLLEKEKKKNTGSQ